MKYAKTLKENLQLLKEGTIYTVIRTKNGKVDYIEKVEQLADGTYMKKAGTSFDRAFIGMDPQEAKNALVKYSHFDPKLIMIDEGCGKIKEAAPAVKVGSKIRVKNGATSWEAEVVKVNDNGTPVILKSIRTKSPDFGKEYKGSWDNYEVIEEASTTSKKEIARKADAAIAGWIHDLKAANDDMQNGDYEWARYRMEGVEDAIKKLTPSLKEWGNLKKAGKLTESIRKAPELDLTDQASWNKYSSELDKWTKELDTKADDMQRRISRMAGRCHYDMVNKLQPMEAEKCFNEFEKIYNELDSLLSKYKIAKN